ncbi:L,D-transpeptidase family protein [Fulvivirga lutea]|uniref:L,D-transpeptidase n=1 Tax=Fulvivirga lutea TaxID=2810512 RepID=A0A974ZZP6_9BACT|nr:L,D-transpeptidase family protein [Fulvivirga lutea]QSE96489.1 L,D-transpeptidase [Fulvivirga lutea]
MRKYLIISILIILVFGLVIFIVDWPQPPLSLLEEARSGLLTAKRAKAEALATDQFELAQVNYDSAMLLLDSENQKMPFFRRYDNVELLLNEAIKNTNLSQKIALEKDKNFWLTSQKSYERVRDLHEYFKHTYSNFPIKEAERKTITEANLMLDEMQLALKNKSVIDINKLTDYEHFITEMINNSGFTLKQYFNDFELWETLQRNALKNATDNYSYVVIVDKLNRECKLYYRSKCLATLPIELGYNWIGDKQHAGDKTTPEGIYRVIKKKQNAETKYYKALLLNYPNEDDKKRHAQKIKDGAIPKNVAIGGEIEIHGHGGKGIDWTDGCVALTNNDMDKMFALIPLNTPVVIVGSTRPLEDLMVVK